MKVLIAEDSHSVRHILSKTLDAWGYDVVIATDGTQAWNLLQAPDAPRLVVLDWMMPGMDGLQICRKLRQEAGALATDRPYTYVILLTARRGETGLLEGMDAGADDYIVKPCTPEELKMRVGAGKRVVSMQTKMINAYERLREEATHDGLTGVLNRQGIGHALERECARVARERHSLAVLLIDLDHFKRVNDGYGHAAGDAVLGAVAERMGRVLRPYDYVGRLGGEEFLIIAPGCDARGGMSVAERVRVGLAASPVQLPDGAHIEVTCSIGVAAVAATDGRGVVADALLGAADKALYEAKRGGRNQVQAAIPLIT